MGVIVSSGSPEHGSHKPGRLPVCASARGTLRRLTLVAMLAVAPVALAGCSFFGPEAKLNLENPDPADKMYADADALLAEGNYEEAAQKFEDLERSHPFSNDPGKPYARRGMALTAFSYYKAAKYDEAIATGKRFLSLYQGTDDAAFVQDIVAASWFDQIQPPEYDQSYARRALVELKTLERLYPNTNYADKARNRIRVTEDALAAHEMLVGRRYLKQNKHLAAINRFKTVVTDYQTTEHVEEALMRLTEAYMALGIRPEAQSAAAILGHNFPDSRWYKDAYTLLASDGLAPREDTGSTISRAWRSVVSSVTGQPT